MLELAILEAMLSSCEQSAEQIMLAVAWGEATLLRRHLERAERAKHSFHERETDAKTHGCALESALVRCAGKSSLAWAIGVSS